MQPGWYEDPWAQGWKRWWDGTGWSAQLLADHRVAARAALVLQAKWARFAIPAVVVGAVAAAIWYFQAATTGVDVTRIGLRYLRDTWRSAQNNEPKPSPPHYPGRSTGFVTSTLFVVCSLGWQIWLYKAARTARLVGIAAKRSPGWAIGAFFVPVVNFWFPYQVARDLFPAGNRNRQLVAKWWTLYLVQFTIYCVISLIGLWTKIASVALAFVGAMVCIAFARATFDLVRTSAEMNQEMSDA